MTGESKISVRTYVPESQKDIWEEHADDLGMSLSEFVRTMVQAGRRDFLIDKTEPSSGETSTNPGQMADLEAQIIDVLEREGPLSWNELIEQLVGDIELDIETSLIELQEDGIVQHRPRSEDYRVVA